VENTAQIIYFLSVQRNCFLVREKLPTDLPYYAAMAKKAMKTVVVCGCSLEGSTMMIEETGGEVFGDGTA